MIDDAQPGDLLFVYRPPFDEDEPWETRVSPPLPTLWKDEFLEEWELIEEDTPLLVLRRFHDEVGVLYEVLTSKGKGVIGYASVKEHSDYEG